MKKKSFHCHCTTPPRRTPERQAWGRRSSRRRNPRPFLPCSRSRAPSSGARGMTNLDLLEVFDMDDARLGSRPPWSSLPSPPPPSILPGHASAWCCVPPTPRGSSSVSVKIFCFWRLSRFFRFRCILSFCLDTHAKSTVLVCSPIRDSVEAKDLRLALSQGARDPVALRVDFLL